MAKLSKKEFAEKCGMETKNLSVYIKRGKVILYDDEQIDDTDLRNLAFIQKRQSKNPIVDSKPVIKTNNVSEKVSSTSDVQKNNEVAALDLQKTSVQVEKLQQEVRLLKIKEDKLKGVVVPSELIKPVFLQHNQSIITEVRNNANEFARIFAKKNDLTVNEVAEINGELINWFNLAISKATQTSVKAINNIMSDFSNKKGVGERE